MKVTAEGISRGKIGWHAERGGIDAIAFPVRQALHEFEALLRHDLRVDPGQIEIAAALLGGSAHVPNEAPALAKVDLAFVRGVATRPPPAFQLLAIGPHAPHLFDWCLDNAHGVHVPLHDPRLVRFARRRCFGRLDYRRGGDASALIYGRYGSAAAGHPQRGRDNENSGTPDSDHPELSPGPKAFVIYRRHRRSSMALAPYPSGQAAFVPS